MKKLSFLLGVVVVLALAFVSARGGVPDSIAENNTIETVAVEQTQETTEKPRWETDTSNQTLREYLAMFYFEYLGIIIALTIVLFWLNKKYKKLTKTIFTVLLYVLLPLFAIVRALYIGYIKQSGREVFEFGRIMGYTCMRLLLLILYAKPLCVGRKKQSKRPVKKLGLAFKKYFGFIVSQRRALGIAVFYLALGHALGYLAFRYTKDTSINSFFYPPAFITGLVAVIALFIGRITSNNRSIKKFKKLRKPLQMTAYLALIGAVVHIFLINKQAGLMLAGLTVFYFILKFFERRRK